VQTQSLHDRSLSAVLHALPRRSSTAGVEQVSVRADRLTEHLGESRPGARIPHRLPQLRARVLDFDRVALHRVTRLVDLLQRLLQPRACGLELAEAGLQPVAKRDQAEGLPGLPLITVSSPGLSSSRCELTFAATAGGVATGPVRR